MFVPPSAFLLVIVCLAAWQDCSKGLINNALTYGGILAGLGLALVGLSVGFASAFFGLVSAGGFFLILWFSGVMGGGDVKLMGAVGALLGWPMVLEAILWTAVAGGVLAVVFLLWKRMPAVAVEGEVSTNIPRRKQRIPYAVAIAAGTWTTVILSLAGR